MFDRKGTAIMNRPETSADLAADWMQDGIYFRPGERPGPCYCLLLVNIHPDTTPPHASEAIATVWTMLQNLRRGVVQDIQPMRSSDPEADELSVPDGKLSCLLGFGARLFDSQFHNPPWVLSAPQNIPQDTMDRPELITLRRDGAGTPFLNLPWVSEGEQRIGEADLAIQFIADTELAVSRAVVEVWKICCDQSLPLDIVTFYSGFNRDDRRSWIDFYDGINNIEASQRRAAIEVVLNNPSWMKGGTYMAFLRLALELTSWRRLSREDQEILVGRDKLTGIPLESANFEPNRGIVPVPSAACPLSRTMAYSSNYISPSRPEDPLLQASHIHRVNPYRQAHGEEANERIFRQGYDFLEPLADGRPRAGLNFVSFQRSLLVLKQILSFWGRLGDVNFGGPKDPKPGEPASVPLASVIAAGYYAVPPKGDPFPGAEIFRGSCSHGV
jgi:Dyp-type peroxidase family